MTDTFRALCDELVTAWDSYSYADAGDATDRMSEAVKDARTALAQPEPQGPISEAELEDGWNQQADQFNQWDSLSLGEQLAWAQARALARFSRPAIEPVALSERLPGPEDCAPWPDDPDANPWAWAGKNVYGGWEWVQLSMQSLGSDALRIIAGGGWTHWAPHYALPVPQQQQEVK